MLVSHDWAWKKGTCLFFWPGRSTRPKNTGRRMGPQGEWVRTVIPSGRSMRSDRRSMKKRLSSRCRRTSTQRYSAWCWHGRRSRTSGSCSRMERGLARRGKYRGNSGASGIEYRHDCGRTASSNCSSRSRAKRSRGSPCGMCSCAKRDGRKCGSLRFRSSHASCGSGFGYGLSRTGGSTRYSGSIAGGGGCGLTRGSGSTCLSFVQNHIIRSGAWLAPNSHIRWGFSSSSGQWQSFTSALHRLSTSYSSPRRCS